MSLLSKLSEPELYDKLLPHIIPEVKLERQGYPVKDPNASEPGTRKPPQGFCGQKVVIRDKFAPSYTCKRCKNVYPVDEIGMQLASVGPCRFHPKPVYHSQLNGRYPCCYGDSIAMGCTSNEYHVHEADLESFKFQDYAETQPKIDAENRKKIFAVDCEMCFTTMGLELTQITVLDYKREIIYQKLVKPERPILDYNSRYSGISKTTLDSVQTKLVDVQKDLLTLFSSDCILVGHSLEHDMIALKLFHTKFLDTAFLYPHKRGLPMKRSLRNLVRDILQLSIQEGNGHSSVEDASAAFGLALHRVQQLIPSYINRYY